MIPSYDLLWDHHTREDCVCVLLNSPDASKIINQTSSVQRRHWSRWSWEAKRNPSLPIRMQSLQENMLGSWRKLLWMPRGTRRIRRNHTWVWVHDYISSNHYNSWICGDASWYYHGFNNDHNHFYDKDRVNNYNQSYDNSNSHVYENSSWSISGRQDRSRSLK